MLGDNIISKGFLLTKRLEGCFDFLNILGFKVEVFILFNSQFC